MPYRLLNVEDAVRTRNGLKVEPGVRLRALLGRISDEDVPLPGDLLEIRFPDGGEDRAQVAAFGWEGLEAGGGLVPLHTDPTDPKFSLVIAGDLPPTAVPRGSEIWLIDHGPARRWNPGRGWDLLAQMARGPEKQADSPLARLLADPPEPAVAAEQPPSGSPTGPEESPAPKPHRHRRRFWRR